MAGARVAALVSIALAFGATAARAQDRLPSWNDGPSKTAIVDFVAKVTAEGSPDFVPIPERLAVFDDDGTLWAEQPLYAELAFALDRAKALAPPQDSWLRMAMATHAGMPTAGLEQMVATAPKAVYQPMLELLAYLRSHGFKTFVVSGGDLELVRPATGRAYGLPPEPGAGRRRTQGGGARLMMVVQHDEVARDRDALLALAKKNGLSVVSMKNDWKRVFPLDPPR
jgi:haloacid dehalogenase-like hydrolase